MQIRALLEQLDATLGPGGEGEAFAPLAYLAAGSLALDPEEVNAARRRALLVLAAGGDPRRALDPDGRAVTGLAEDLDSPPRRAELRDALAGLCREAAGLASVAGAAEALLADDELAWRWIAVALLAEELVDEPGAAGGPE